MKYILLLSLFFLHTSLVFAIPTTCTILPNDPRSADQILTACGGGTIGIDPLQSSNNGKEAFKDRIIMIAGMAISFGALLAVGALVWSGIQYTKAFGDDENLKKAKTTGIYAIIGLILLVASFGLVDIFINFIYTLAGE